MSDLSRLRVVIFAPHTTCNGPTRDCDLRARYAADKVYEELKARGFDDSNLVYLKHNVHRFEQYDLNRFQSRVTAPREELRKTIYKFYDDAKHGLVDRIYLLEMHSFPDGWEVPISGRNIVVLNRLQNEDVGCSLVKHLGGSRDRVELFIGTEVCDIQTEFTPGRNHIVPFLVEASEDTESFSDAALDAKLAQLADYVARDLAAPIVTATPLAENVVDFNPVPASSLAGVLLSALIGRPRESRGAAKKRALLVALFVLFIIMLVFVLLWPTPRVGLSQSPRVLFDKVKDRLDEFVQPPALV